MGLFSIFTRPKQKAESEFKKYTLAPLIAELMTIEELEMLQRHFGFLESLVNGTRKPNTNDQAKFIKVAKGVGQPTSDFEKIWFRYSKASAIEIKMKSLEESIKLLRCENEALLLEKKEYNSELKHLKSLTIKLEAENTVLVKTEEKLKASNGCVNLTEDETNSMISILCGRTDQDSQRAARLLIDKIKQVHQPKPPSTNEKNNMMVCQACGSNSPNLCRCSE